MGHRVLVDSFAELDTERLALLFADDPNYVPLTDAEIATLENIKAVIVDKDWFMIFDNFMNFTEQYNGEGLYWNYWYHVWKTFSVSPFANAIVFTSAQAGVTSVTVSPSTATVVAGGTVQLSASVVTTGFAPQTVTWSSADETVATVNANGVVTVSADATSADTVVITATSTYDNTVSGTATITVG
jgi:Bacterial Ig-like domain (group 2).